MFSVICCEKVYFNSHPHEEDDGRTIVEDGLVGISTHILTRRMTIATYICMTLLMVFQLTSSRGG